MKDQALQRVSDRISAHLSSTAKAHSGIHCVTDDFDEFRVSLNNMFYSANIDLIGEQNLGSCAELWRCG
ncbi:hypothetical protein [Mycobacterium montefiorense]|uniref:hypothetical protein n=1 Tax=Mycobacterium montefiorense TaxID=154654 RepID=UPI0021DCFDA5|nr:hypothetical protein [Mycobacterium montefiorense]MCV7425518.1 hypothetical protein [Mycobacterium montefiorense]GLE52603.1 hypothetical protein ATCCBAA256_21660 [Mycobacterium montefiorense]